MKNEIEEQQKELLKNLPERDYVGFMIRVKDNTVRFHERPVCFEYELSIYYVISKKFLHWKWQEEILFDKFLYCEELKWNDNFFSFYLELEKFLIHLGILGHDRINIPKKEIDY